MLMSLVESGVGVGPYPELAGKRILITGLATDRGVDVARAFAEQGCRMVLHAAGMGAEDDAILEMLSLTAAELQVYSEPLADAETTVRFAQSAASAFGGLDAAINVLALDTRRVPRTASAEEIERAVADQLYHACLVTRVAANRMRLTWSEGVILNVMTCTQPHDEPDAQIVALARTMLAGMTRSEARQWADQAIRINAVAPSGEAHSAGQCLASEPDIAALALFLASGRGQGLSGLVFNSSVTGHPG